VPEIRGLEKGLKQESLAYEGRKKLQRGTYLCQSRRSSQKKSPDEVPQARKADRKHLGIRGKGDRARKGIENGGK